MDFGLMERITQLEGRVQDLQVEQERLHAEMDDYFRTLNKRIANLESTSIGAILGRQGNAPRS